MNPQDTLAKETELQVKKIQDGLKDALSWIPDDLPIEGVYHTMLTFDGHVRVVAPFNRALMESNKRAMIDAGYRLVSDVNEYESAQSGFYPDQAFATLDGLHQIQIAYSYYADGAVCQRREIGKTTKEVSVYEFACASLMESEQA